MSVYREADSSAPLAITPAIDFAIVLSRTLADLNKDPAQLRNVVYQLARIKLEQEVAQRNSRVDPVEMKQLSLALESAIDRVETIYSKCDNPRLLSCSQSSPAADRPRIAIEPPRPPHAIAIFSPHSCVGFLGLESRAQTHGHGSGNRADPC